MALFFVIMQPKFGHPNFSQMADLTSFARFSRFKPFEDTQTSLFK
jgi:hypothetical protein